MAGFAYNPADWYWAVGGHPGERFSSYEAQYVPLADARYAAWVAAGNTATSIQPDGELAVVLADAGLKDATLAVDPTNFNGQADADIIRAVTFAGVEVTSLCEFTGSLSGSTLTVSAVTSGALAVGDLITGSGIALGTEVSSLGTGTGGTGTYTVSMSGTLGSRAMTADVPYAGIYELSGGLFDVAVQTLLYTTAFGAFPNGNTEIAWITREGTVMFPDVSSFETVVRAQMDYLATWQQWILLGSPPAPNWGIIEL